ncbi:NADH dehydrogenase [ubiquinone] iron-sulfur protein 6, mitochondrial-like [Biomphalaria glabrata]|uniref:NADH dehydrogenase [ubiquinone] iron-sulfur protein 6, mitochondrial-like n=1 Tax=Biomphalaria glabrata TaxID=6526 RepID=A0A9U8EHT9_BIOGL|nr:NADH dehydrogenase [ubiquinone] iron-sulfur protein 6, mitochondrial-like [Biomphalaria glabrata]
MAALSLRMLSKSKANIVATSVRAFSASTVKYINEGPNVYKPTHTGQVWDKDDYRNLRFVDKDKLINPNWAINLIQEDPVVVVDKNHAWSNSCGALGHPKVYINLDKPEIAVCGYSGRKFIQKKYYNEAKHGPSITYEAYLEQMKGDSR